MGKFIIFIIGQIIGGLICIAALIFMFGWGKSGHGQIIHVDPTRADYIDLILTVLTILLAAIGLAVTVGALFIGIIAFRTLGEIKRSASKAAVRAASKTINATIEKELVSNVHLKVDDIMPAALKIALVDNDLGYAILSDLAAKGDLDKVFERVSTQIMVGHTYEVTDNSEEFS